MTPLRSSFLALCLSACTAAAPIATVAQAPACGEGSPSFALIQHEAEAYGWSLTALNPVQLRHALAAYNAVPPDHLNASEVDSAYVGEHDGAPPRFVFFKNGCNVGKMLVVGPTVYAQVMGHDA